MQDNGSGSYEQHLGGGTNWLLALSRSSPTGAMVLQILNMPMAEIWTRPIGGMSVWAGRSKPI